MEDGDYAMQLDVDGSFSRNGRLTACDNVLEASDDMYALTGTVQGSERHTTGSLTIDLAAGASGNAQIRGRFVMSVSGTTDRGALSLIGTGPLGIIIELRGSKRG